MNTVTGAHVSTSSGGNLLLTLNTSPTRTRAMRLGALRRRKFFSAQEHPPGERGGVLGLAQTPGGAGGQAHGGEGAATTLRFNILGPLIIELAVNGTGNEPYAASIHQEGAQQ